MIALLVAYLDCDEVDCEADGEAGEDAGEAPRLLSLLLRLLWFLHGAHYSSATRSPADRAHRSAGREP